MPGTDGDAPVSEHSEDEVTEEEPQDKPQNLEVNVTQIGDIVFICRNQIMSGGGQISRSQSFKQVSESDPDRRSVRFTLLAEGIADNKVSGIVADEWLKDPHMCLFRIETPSMITAATSGSKDESKANKESFRKSQGAVLKYGQEVQLRHIHSNRLLSLDLLAAANAPGAWSVIVNAPTSGLCRQISLLPFNRSHNIGDPIRYGEAMSIVFQTENLKYFVQSEVISPDLLDINATHKPANWKFLKFQAHDEEMEAIRFGETMTIKYSKLGMYMALQRERVRPIKATKGVLPPILLRRSETDHLGDPRLPIATKSEVDDFSHFWVLQNINVMEGGAVKWSSKFYIKNALTGQFLGQGLKLDPHPDPNFYFFFPKPDSFLPDSPIPNGYPLMIKCKGDMVLTPDGKKSNEEALDHLVPITAAENQFESKEIGMSLEFLAQDQRESLFELDYVSELESRFFNMINSLYPKFVEIRDKIESFKKITESTGRKSWEATEQLEKRLTTMVGALENVASTFSSTVGDELESIQRILTGLKLHAVLIDIASILHTLFESQSIKDVATDVLVENSKLNLSAIWNLLNDAVLENESSARKIAEYQVYLCELLKYDTLRIGSLLTEVFRLVDPEIKDPKQFYHQWCSRLENLTKRNLQEQVIYMRIIRNLCEIGDMGALEYQKEITRHLFVTEIAIDLVIFCQHQGQFAVRFGGRAGTSVGLDEFQVLNPDLAPFVKEDADGNTILLLTDLSGLEDYVEYVQTALMLFHAICRGRCEMAREFVRERLGISVETALLISQNLSVNIDIRQAFLFLLEALCISAPPFEPTSENDTSFGYVDIKMMEGKESFRQPLFSPHTDPYVSECLKMVFDFWMTKDTPAAIAKKEPFSVLNYLLSMLRVTLAIVEYKHCTELYALIIQKAVQYLLVGFTESAPSYSAHWGADLIAKAVKKGVTERRIRLIVNELLAGVLSNLLAIKKSGRRLVLMQVISKFIKEAKNFENPLFGTGLLGQEAYHVIVDELKDIVDTERCERMIADFIKRVDKTKRNPNLSFTQSVLNQTTLPIEGFVPSGDFKEIVAKAPPLREVFIRVILEWANFSTALKNKMIDVMNEIFKEKRLFNKFLRTSDVISLGPIAVIYNRLRWVKDNSEMSSMIVRAKFECMTSGQSKSLMMIVHTLEYLINFVHPRNGTSEFVLNKTQNIMRQLGIIKEVMMLWNLVHHLDRMGKGRDTPTVRLKGGLITFMLFFIKGNPANVKSLAKMMAPTYYIMSIVQYPSLLRLMNDYNHLQIRDVNRLIVYILEVVQQSDKELPNLTFLEKLMVDRTGMLKRNIQNVASTLLSEKVATAFEVAKDRPMYLAMLIENLALSAEDNTPVITQCRHLISFSHLSEMILNETNPLILSALCYFLFTVYVKKLPGSKEAREVKMLSQIGDMADVVEYILKLAIEQMKNPKQILKFAKDGSYPLVYFTQNPSYTDININIQNASPELMNWIFLCKEFDGRQSGVLKYIPDILECVELEISMQPILKGFHDALSECKVKVQAMQSQTRGLLCFEPLLNIFSQASARLKKCAEKIQVELEDTLCEFSCEIEEEVLAELRETSAMSIPFISDPASDGETAVDQSMANVMKIGYQQFTKMFSLENEDDYINAIVGLIDQRLTKGLELTKYEVKDLIASLGRKIRRLQKLFTSSKQRVQLFRIIEGIVPEEDMAEFKIQLNPLFRETNVIGMALSAVMSHQSHEEVIAALSFLHKLFLLQDPNFMEEFRIKLNDDGRAYPLFIKIQEELGRAKGFVLDLVSREKTRKEMSVISKMAGAIVKAKGKEEVGTKQNQILIRMLDFIQICCDNCNEPFQIFYREQKNTEGKADVDLVTAVAMFLIDIRFAREYLFVEPTIFAILNAALGALADFVTGPCITNQKMLGNNVRLYLVMNTMISYCQAKTEPEQIKVHRNCIKLLCTLLEGHPDPSVPETMTRFLNLAMIRQGCEDVYNRFVVGHEEELSLESSSLSDEYKEVVVNSIQQAILLKKLKDIGVIHDELIKFEAQIDDPTYSFGFYTKYTGYVEIDRNGELESHLFVIPWKCKYITPSTRQYVVMDVNRASHQEKIKDFLGKVTLCRMEMEHQQMLYNSKTLKSFSLRWALFGKISFYITLTINIVLLRSITEVSFSDLKDNIAAFTIVAILGVLQIFAYMSAFFFQLLEYYPQALAKAMRQPQEFEMDQFPKVSDSDSHVMQELYASLVSTERKDYRTELQEKIKETLFNFDLYYTYTYFMLSIIAVYEPVFYSFLLLDVIKQTPELINVLNSVTQNFRQLILTMWLEVVLIYLFTIISFVMYSEFYITDNNLYCGDLWNCFFSTLQMGIRNGGDFMDIADDKHYWTRMLYDMMFWLINIIILMNVIFGIIIDTFAELRDGRTQILEDIHNCCYVCGNERSQIELKGAGWSYHFMREHSVFAYLSFLIYIGEKKVYNCSGLEKHCKERFDKMDTSFMPKSSILMEGGSEQEIKTGDED